MPLNSLDHLHHHHHHHHHHHTLSTTLHPCTSDGNIATIKNVISNRVARPKSVIRRQSYRVNVPLQLFDPLERSSHNKKLNWLFLILGHLQTRLSLWTISSGRKSWTNRNLAWPRWRRSFSWSFPTKLLFYPHDTWRKSRRKTGSYFF